MKKAIAILIEQTKATIAFKQKWHDEHPNDVNVAKMHFLDGRLEALEEVLKLEWEKEVNAKNAAITTAFALGLAVSESKPPSSAPALPKRIRKSL